MSERKLIYNQKYPAPDWSCLDDKFDNMTGEEFKEHFFNYLKEFEKEIVYKINPEKQWNKNGYIKIAQIISQEFRIDTKIWEDEQNVYVEFFHEYGPITNLHKNYLSQIMIVSDSVDFFQEDDGFSINLVYSICDMYHNNKKIQI